MRENVQLVLRIEIIQMCCLSKEKTVTFLLLFMCKMSNKLKITHQTHVFFLQRIQKILKFNRKYELFIYFVIDL
jgi:hypothetical protein